MSLASRCHERSDGALRMFRASEMVTESRGSQMPPSLPLQNLSNSRVCTSQPSCWSVLDDGLANGIVSKKISSSNLADITVRVGVEPGMYLFAASVISAMVCSMLLSSAERSSERS